MNVANDDSLELYSSVKIQKLGKNKPLEVNIVTPQNITKVTADMYRNAAVTLGLEHASNYSSFTHTSDWRKCLGWDLLLA